MDFLYLTRQAHHLFPSYTYGNKHAIMKITTPHLILRDWSYDDTESLVKHADNPRIAAMMRDAFPSPYT